MCQYLTGPRPNSGLGGLAEGGHIDFPPGPLKPPPRSETKATLHLALWWRGAYPLVSWVLSWDYIQVFYQLVSVNLAQGLLLIRLSKVSIVGGAGLTANHLSLKYQPRTMRDLYAQLSSWDICANAHIPAVIRQTQ